MGRPLIGMSKHGQRQKSALPLVLPGCNMCSMSELDDTLVAAREAYDAATRALRLAEEAAGQAGASTRASFLDVLTVKRINVVENDGTLRMVIGNSAHSRTMPMRGRHVQHPGRAETAGILFVNDEGTECGGLQFGGGRTPDGVEHGGYLTFDDYEQNESFRFGLAQDAGGSTKFLEFSDQPEWSIADLVEEIEGLDPEEAAQVQHRYIDREHGVGRSRMRLAREADGSVGLVLRDGAGRERLRLVVPEDGDAVVEVVDAHGNSRSLL